MNVSISNSSQTFQLNWKEASIIDNLIMNKEYTIFLLEYQTSIIKYLIKRKFRKVTILKINENDNDTYTKSITYPFEYITVNTKAEAEAILNNCDIKIKF